MTRFRVFSVTLSFLILFTIIFVGCTKTSPATPIPAPTPTPVPSAPAPSPTPKPSPSPAPTQKLPSGKPMSLVSAQGTEFMIDGKPFRFVGAFTFPWMSQLLYDIWDKSPGSIERKIDKYLESLPESVNVIRVFAFGPSFKSYYGAEEPNWKRLDYLVKSAEAHGVYLIWVLYDSWDYSEAGGLPGYRFEFWKVGDVKQKILAQVARYKDSPAIFGWELMNEGDNQVWPWEKRAEILNTEVLNWVDDVSRAIKAIDSRHLVSTGFTNENLLELKFKAPDAYAQMRESVINIHKLPGIDFVTFHVYGGNPDLQKDASFFTEKWKSEVTWYFDEMARIKEELGKPVVCEEFGVQRQVGEPARKEIYEFYFSQVLRQKVSCLFNGWGDDKRPISLAIYTYDEEYNTIIDAATKIKIP